MTEADKPALILVVEDNPPNQMLIEAVLTGAPVAALTAHALANDDQLSLDAGRVGYITKPFDTRLLPDQVVGFLINYQ